MRAYQLTVDGHGLTEVPDPVPGPGEVVVKVAAAGLCHSDLTLAARRPEEHPFDLPIVLGHELAGEVVELGPGVTALEVGASVVGYGPRGCRTCAECVSGFENWCSTPPSDVRLPGFGGPGALAEYAAIDAAYIMGSAVDPVQGAALTDAGLTALGALNRATRLRSPEARRSAIVIGIGGLGHLAVQLAGIASYRTIIAVDIEENKVQLAKRLGATHAVRSSPSAAAKVRDVLGGRGADVVLDFVGAQQTLELAAAIVGPGSSISIVGVGAGRLPVGSHALPSGVTIDLPYWGGRSELIHLLDLAAAGRIAVHAEEVALAEVAAAYQRLATGSVLGRLVARP